MSGEDVTRELLDKKEVHQLLIEMLVVDWMVIAESVGMFRVLALVTSVGIARAYSSHWHLKCLVS